MVSFKISVRHIDGFCRALKKARIPFDLDGSLRVQVTQYHAKRALEIYAKKFPTFLEVRGGFGSSIAERE